MKIKDISNRLRKLIAWKEEPKTDGAAHERKTLADLAHQQAYRKYLRMGQNAVRRDSILVDEETAGIHVRLPLPLHCSR